MLSKIYNWALGLVTIAAGVLGLLLSIQTQRNKKLTSEANSAKKDAERAAEQLQRNVEVIQQAEARRKDVLATESGLKTVEKKTLKAVENARNVDVKDKVTFGKWVLIFAVLFAASGCGATLSECRSAYPCPDNVCVSVTPPKLETFPRPELIQLAVSYDEAKQGFVLTPEQIGSLLGNERVLIETIKGYEKIIDVYNEWRIKQ